MKIAVSRTRMENFLIHARQCIGSDISGKLVSEVRKEAIQLFLSENH